MFGPKQNPASQYAAVIPIFIRKAIDNEPITVYGDGEQTRDFIYVKDVVSANVLAATNPDTTEVFNVASGHTTTIMELARLIISETGSKSRIVHENERPGDIKHSLASIERTKHVLKVEPRFTLLDGLRRTIEFLRKSRP